MNDLACSSKSLDHFEISSDSSSNGSIIWDRETPHIPNSSNPALVQKYNKCDSPYNNARQRIEELNIINSTQTHVGDTHIGDTHINNHYHIGNGVLPRELEAKLQNQVEAENGYAEHNAESVPSDDQGNAPCHNATQKKSVFKSKEVVIPLVCVSFIVAVFVVLIILASVKFPLDVVEPPINDLVNREKWGAEAAAGNLTQNNPARLVIFKHTRGSSCTDFNSCKARVKEIQKEDMKKYPDISYNFLVGGDGRIYEGRGWMLMNEGVRNESVDFAFVGDFNQEVPTSLMIENVRNIITLGLGDKIDYSHYYVVNHNQTEPTDSPGENVFKAFTNFNHYWSGICYRNESGTVEVFTHCPP